MLHDFLLPHLLLFSGLWKRCHAVRCIIQWSNVSPTCEPANIQIIISSSLLKLNCQIAPRNSGIRIGARRMAMTPKSELGTLSSLNNPHRFEIKCRTQFWINEIKSKYWWQKIYCARREGGGGVETSQWMLKKVITWRKSGLRLRTIPRIHSQFVLPPLSNLDLLV
jgi:hypothetical protein